MQAEEALDFLASEYQFSIGHRDVQDISDSLHAYGATRFVDKASAKKDDQWFVVLSMAPWRLELDLDIGIHSEGTEETYSIRELHALNRSTDFPEITHDLNKAMHDGQALFEEVGRLANVLRSSGARFFAKDKTLWNDLRAARHAREKEFRDAQSYAASKRAFSAKDWKHVIDILEPRKTRLDDLNRARLDYARKRLGRGPSS